MKRVRLMVLCLLWFVAGCTPISQLTTSGSEMWSRGVILGTTPKEAVAVAAWDDETFVAWFGADGALRLAQLDAAMNTVEIADVSLTAVSPQNLRLIAAADQLDLTWIDSVDGLPTLVYARVAVGQETPLAYQSISLAEDARHVEALLNLEGQRLDVFWSDLSDRSEGLYHQASSLAGDLLASPTRLTDSGWQPGASRDADGQIHLAWADEGVGGYAAVWYALFVPDSQSLEEPRIAAEVRLRRGMVLEGPVVGAVSGAGVAAWSAGDRRPALTGRGDVPAGSEQLGGRVAPLSEPFGRVDGDRAHYAIVPPATEQLSPARSLVVAPVIAALGEPRLCSAEGEVWAVYSGYVARRSTFRLQVLAMSLSEEETATPVPISRTQSGSLYPDLAVEGGTLRAVWLEPIDDEMYRVIVANTGSAAREALGGFLWAEWLHDVVLLGMDAVGLLGFFPLVLQWTALPLGLVLVATWVGGRALSGRRTALWLGAALIVHLIGKGFVAVQLSPFQTDIVQAALALIPLVLGGGAVWLYWRRAASPMPIVAYGLFAGIDAACSLFILLPRVLWGV
jgi:hypothetical protein